MFKRAIFLIPVFCLLFVFFSCKEKKSKTVDEDITLVMAEVNPPDSVIGLMDQAFKRKVEDLSAGKIKIDLQCSGILGDEKQIMALIMQPHSSIQIVRGPANLSSYSGGKPVKSSLISIPYTFKNDDHFWRFANSEIAQEMLDEPYQLGLGVKGLFYAQEGLRHFISTEKIQSVSDLKNKKMRVSGNTLTALCQAFQSDPINIKFTELYAGFQTGRIEVAEQPLSNYLSNSLNYVAPYMILDGHMLGAVSVMINASCWDSLSDRQKNILITAGKYSSLYCHKILDEKNAETIQQLKKKSATIIEVKDQKSWQDACSQMRKEAASIDPQLYQKILDLAD